MAALVVHASKDGESIRTLFTSPVLAVAKARGLFKTGWQVHVVDADGRVFHSEKLDHLLRFLPSRRPIRVPVQVGLFIDANDLPISLAAKLNFAGPSVE